MLFDVVDAAFVDGVVAVVGGGVDVAGEAVVLADDVGVAAVGAVRVVGGGAAVAVAVAVAVAAVVGVGVV